MGKKVQQDMYATLNFDKMRARCLASIEDFYTEGQVFDTKDGPYIFKDNGADILFVAHLDTVQPQGVNHFYVSRTYDEFTSWDADGKQSEQKQFRDMYVHSAHLDDRLGVYLVLDYFSQYMKYDVLLTTNEESGRSTAGFFIPPNRQYKWIAEFDRGGDDSVTYQYDDPTWEKALKGAGLRLGMGTYSDIADLEHLGACGVNVGVGYVNYHSPKAYASMTDLLGNIRRFAGFYKANRKIAYSYDPLAAKPRTTYYSKWSEGDMDRYMRNYQGTSASTAALPKVYASRCEICENWIDIAEDKACYKKHGMCVDCYLNVYEKVFNPLEEIEKSEVEQFLITGDWLWIDVPDDKMMHWGAYHQHTADFIKYTKGGQHAEVEVELESNSKDRKLRKVHTVLPVAWLSVIDAKTFGG
jgi:hypothetical protein